MLNTNLLTNPYRCAVYFAPNLHSPWGQAGGEWLGRCAATSKNLPQPSLVGISSEEQLAFTSEPRRYGWHATLKAPFSLSPGETVSSLLSGLEMVAKTLSAFDMPTLQVSTHGGFMALRPRGDVTAINHVAATCVKELHRFAAPLSASDMARRRKSALTPEQDQLLQDWGYPYVLGAFEFHLTLTNKLVGMSSDKIKAWHDAVESHFVNLGTCRFDRLALFVEPEPGADFQLFDWVALPP